MRYGDADHHGDLHPAPGARSTVTSRSTTTSPSSTTTSPSGGDVNADAPQIPADSASER